MPAHTSVTLTASTWGLIDEVADGASVAVDNPGSSRLVFRMVATAAGAPTGVPGPGDGFSVAPGNPIVFSGPGDLYAWSPDAVTVPVLA